MQFFDQLGTLIEQRRKDKNYNESILHDIAAQALAEAETLEKVDPCLKVSAEDIVRTGRIRGM
jgi:hypothetical protein